LLLLAATNEPAFASCTAFGQGPSVSGPTFFTSYDPTNTANTVVSTTFTITPPSGMSPPCSLYVVLHNPQGMTNPSETITLTYSVGGDLASAISTGNSSGLLVSLSPGTPQTFSASITIPARQNKPQGSYTETLDLRLYASNGQFLSQFIPTATANVIASCVLPAPSVSSLNFSSGIVNGRVVSGYKLSALIQGTSCSGAAQLVLRGTPLVTGSSAQTGLDNKIYYQAVARLGSASATLSVDSSSEALVSLPATSGTVSIDVTLVDKGKMQAAGSYSSVLSVVLQPSN
jgi:hypothetical protein